MKNLLHICKALFLGLLLVSCGRADRMHSLLEQAEWMNQNDSLFTSDSIGKVLVRYYDHWWHPADLRLRAYYMLGCAYRDMGNAPRALENYQRAAAQVDTLTAPDSTLNRLMRVHSQMSQIYLLQRLPELEEQELQTAECLAWRTGDTLSALIFKERECNILYNLGEYERCLQETLSLHVQYKKCGYPNQALLAYGLCIKSNLALKNYRDALYYIKECEKCPYFYSCPEKVYAGIYGLHLLKAQYYLGIEQVDSAIYYFNNTLHCPNNDAIRLLAYKGLFQSYTLSNSIDSISKYASLYSDAKEKNYNEEVGQASIQSKALYDYSVEQQIARQKKDENTRLYLFLIILTFTATIVITVFLYRNEKRKREISELRQRHLSTVNDLQQAEQTVIALKIAQSSDESRIVEYAEKATRLKAQADHYQSIIKRVENKKSDLTLEKSHIVARFKYSLTHFSPDDKLQEKHWDELKKIVEEQYPLFYQIVNGTRKLYENEYRVCLLVKAGFSPIDIDLLMDKKHTYASKTRRRLHKKIFGYDGLASDFDRKIRNI